MTRKGLTFTDVDEMIREGNFDDPLEWIESQIFEADYSRFHVAVYSEFSNPPEEIARHMDQFYRKEMTSYSVTGICVRLNASSEWAEEMSVTMDGYSSVAWPEDRSIGLPEEETGEPFPPVALTGMEALQEVFARKDKSDETEEHSHLLYYGQSNVELAVSLKLMNLIRESTAFVKQVDCPLFACAGCHFAPVWNP